MTRPAPRTSFVIPARNAAATLAQTLNSLLAQSETDWEALIVDDGSHDETPQLIAAHAACDARFLALRGSGTEGVSAARNVGLAQARGRRVVFLDSDDWIAPGFLAHMHTALDAAPGAAAAYCDHQRVMPDGALAPVHSDPDVARAPFETFARTCAVAIHAVLIERETVLRAGRFATELRTCEDWDLWQRVARQGGRWVHVAEPLAFYRTVDHSLSQDVERVLADASVVVHRGFAADPRLPDADPAHAAGASCAHGSTAALTLAYAALWAAAVDAARGHHPRRRAELQALPSDSDHAAYIAAALLEGLTVGLCTVPQQLAARWAEYGPRFTALIQTLGAMWSDSVAARRAHYAFERLLLQHDGLAAPRALHHTLGLAVNLRAPALITLPLGVDRLYVHLCDGERVLGVAEPGALGQFARQEWFELAARQLGWKAVLRTAAPALARLVTPRRLAAAARSARQSVQRSAWREHGWRRVGKGAARAALVAVAAPLAHDSGHRTELQRLREEAARATFDGDSTRRTERYRLNHFAREKTVEKAASETRQIQTEIEHAVALRSELRTERHQRLPVLDYHRVAEDGPLALARHRVGIAAFAEQMAWLRRHGYHTIVADQLAWFLQDQHPFVGRPVMITFDAGYQDFAETAWPVLRRHDFRAEVFVVTDVVGGRAEWDSRFGEPAPLMDAETIAALAAEGVHFGSQLATHRGADGLSTHELAEELLRSQRCITQWTGMQPCALAAPFGLTDQRLQGLAAQCGYAIGFSAESDAASLSSEPMRLPRIEVRGDMALEEFVSVLEACR